MVFLRVRAEERAHRGSTVFEHYLQTCGVVRHDRAWRSHRCAHRPLLCPAGVGACGGGGAGCLGSHLGLAGSEGHGGQRASLLHNQAVLPVLPSRPRHPERLRLPLRNPSITTGHCHPLRSAPFLPTQGTPRSRLKTTGTSHTMPSPVHSYATEMLPLKHLTYPFPDQNRITHSRVHRTVPLTCGPHCRLPLLTVRDPRATPALPVVPQERVPVAKLPPARRLQPRTPRTPPCGSPRALVSRFPEGFLAPHSSVSWLQEAPQLLPYPLLKVVSAVKH